MKVRQALPSDFDAIVSFDHVAHDNFARRDFISRSIEEKAAYVAIQDATIVGYAVLDYTFFGNGFISMLYVAPKFRRFGYGFALVQYVEHICKTHKLFTSTNESNVQMQSLLDKLGFQRSGQIDNLDVGDPELVYFKFVGGESG